MSNAKTYAENVYSTIDSSDGQQRPFLYFIENHYKRCSNKHVLTKRHSLVNKYR